VHIMCTEVVLLCVALIKVIKIIILLINLEKKILALFPANFQLYSKYVTHS
jgi:hypothetical protein